MSGRKTRNNPDGTTAGELTNLLCWAEQAVKDFARWDTVFDRDASLSYCNLSVAVNQATLFLKDSGDKEKIKEVNDGS